MSVVDVYIGLIRKGIKTEEEAPSLIKARVEEQLNKQEGKQNENEDDK